MAAIFLNEPTFPLLGNYDEFSYRVLFVESCLSARRLLGDKVGLCWLPAVHFDLEVSTTQNYDPQSPTIQFARSRYAGTPSVQEYRVDVEGKTY